MMQKSMINYMALAASLFSGLDAVKCSNNTAPGLVDLDNIFAVRCTGHTGRSTDPRYELEFSTKPFGHESFTEDDVTKKSMSANEIRNLFPAERFPDIFKLPKAKSCTYSEKARRRVAHLQKELPKQTFKVFTEPKAEGTKSYFGNLSTACRKRWNTVANSTTNPVHDADPLSATAETQQTKNLLGKRGKLLQRGVEKTEELMNGAENYRDNAKAFADKLAAQDAALDAVVNAPRNAGKAVVTSVGKAASNASNFFKK